ncbi:MAG: response regulator transcription factor [Chitinophagaceae bacterium]|nr:response regulator transcription factor [Chitinophagaceae bacterium]MDP1763197.1 response regulator transcription factor [Sediminibacterium sp.]MDP1812788.1 response regulator transcription factor [Sediminibacterium sp.]MDP3129523.1 response regulator transcription factor [Sediminibacterium sp.]
MNLPKKISIALADDHAMLRKGLIKLLMMLGNYESLFDVDNGNEVIEQLKKHKIPDVLILDVNMAEKDGYQTAQWVSTHYPQVRILALSMFSDENTIIKMIRAGAKGYITKNSDPEKLKEAIDTLYEKGVYLPESLSAKIFSGIKNNILFSEDKATNLTEKEKTFLSLLCQELSYQEIAGKMFLSPRTVDDYRKKLTRKLNVKGKSGLIVYAMSNGLK